MWLAFWAGVREKWEHPKFKEVFLAKLRGIADNYPQLRAPSSAAHGCTPSGGVRRSRRLAGTEAAAVCCPSHFANPETPMILGATSSSGLSIAKGPQQGAAVRSALRRPRNQRSFLGEEA